MSLEPATFIADLVRINPVGTADAFSTGASHLRLIKAVLQATFPNVDAQVTASSADLNLLLDKSLTPTQIQPYPAGTKKLFLQAAAPVGWTQDATQNDKVFRVVDGSTGNVGATTGGTWTLSGSRVYGTALTIDQMPVHTHGTKYDTLSVPGAKVEGIMEGIAKSNSDDGGGFQATSRATLSLENLNPLTFPGSAADHFHPDFISDGVWRPAYSDTIICTKDAT